VRQAGEPVTATGDALLCADVLLQFVRRGAGQRAAAGIAMAKYGGAVRRIDRVLNSRYPLRATSPRVTTATVSSLVLLGYLVAAAQPRLAFDVTDVHPSVPPVKGSVVQMEGGETVRGGRYEARNATLVDLIRVAYGVDAAAVIGGPPWLAADRFDVIAKPPDGRTSDAAVKEMLRSLLQDRFKLGDPLRHAVFPSGAAEPSRPGSEHGAGTGERERRD